MVDQNLTHIWKPLLHEIAAGSLNPHEEQTNYFAHAEKHHYEFVLGTLTAVNKDKKIIDLIPLKSLKNKYPYSTTQLRYTGFSAWFSIK